MILMNKKCVVEIYDISIGLISSHKYYPHRRYNTSSYLIVAQPINLTLNCGFLKPLPVKRLFLPS